MKKKQTTKAKEHKAWKNRIVGHEDWNPLEIVTNPANYKAHPDQQRDALAGAIGEVGFIRSVTINKRTGTLIDGHLRVALAIRQKQKTLPVELVDLSPAEERAALACLDPLVGLAEYDQEKLGKLAKELGGSTPSIASLLNDLVDRDEAEEEEKGHRRPAANTQATIGAFRFVIRRKEYERWLEALRKKVGFDEEDGISEIKKRLGFN